MTFGWRPTVFGTMVALSVCLLGVAVAARQAGPDQAPPMSDTVFENIQVLKGIPVDEFMDVMGMFSAALGFDCASCHSSEISTDRAAFAIATPQVQRARQMIVMMNGINRTYFGGQPRMSCFTCHTGKYQPESIPSLALQYSEFFEDPNAIAIFPDTGTTVGEVFGKYIQALGGAQRLASLTSLVARGTYEGFNTGGGAVPIEIFSAAPDKRTQVVQAPSGPGVKTFDGRNGWVAEPWRPMPLMTLTGGNLSGARLEAILSFPAGIQGPSASGWSAARASTIASCSCSKVPTPESHRSTFTSTSPACWYGRSAGTGRRPAPCPRRSTTRITASSLGSRSRSA